MHGFEREGLFGNCWDFGATTVVARQVERIEFGAPVGAIIATINKYDNRIDNVFCGPPRGGIVTTIKGGYNGIQPPGGGIAATIKGYCAAIAAQTDDR